MMKGKMGEAPEQPKTSDRSGLGFLLPPGVIFELVIPLMIVACALLMPLIYFGAEIGNAPGMFFLGSALTALFPLWPLILLIPLLYRTHRLRAMLIWWATILSLWIVFTLIIPEGMPFELLPEPYNTVLFFITGEVLIALALMRKGFRKAA